jgi:nucleoside-diphosphate-sugar epimerase
MRILIIGGTGFIGSHVVERLARHGHSLAVFHRGGKNIDLPPGVQQIFGNRHSLSSFKTDFKDFAPDVVLDMIPFTELEAISLMNVFRGVARRLIALSSGDVYRNYELLRRTVTGPAQAAPLREDAALRESRFPHRSKANVSSDRYYNYEKIFVERTVMSEPELPGTILRLPVVYGPGDWQHRLFPYLKRMRDGRKSILLEAGQEKWRWTRGYVENVAAAIALAVGDDRAANRIYNVGERAALTEEEWIRHIAGVMGWRGSIVPVEVSLLPEKMKSGLDWEHHLVTDTHRMRDELGYVEEVPFPEGLARTVAWEEESPPENIQLEQFDYAAEDVVLSKLEQQAL